jgi:hypothetical protein
LRNRTTLAGGRIADAYRHPKRGIGSFSGGIAAACWPGFYSRQHVLFWASGVQSLFHQKRGAEAQLGDDDFWRLNAAQGEVSLTAMG